MLAPLVRAAAAALFATAALAQATLDAAAADVVGADAAAWRAHRETRVLYAGSPGGTREAAFRAFLERHFDTVAGMDLAKLTKANAAPYDVVIADWTSQYGKDGYPSPGKNSLTSAPGSLPVDFDVPVIAMDYVSSNLRRDYKLDWL
jgi:hypothetical protein